MLFGIAALSLQRSWTLYTGLQARYPPPPKHPCSFHDSPSKHRRCVQPSSHPPTSTTAAEHPPGPALGLLQLWGSANPQKGLRGDFWSPWPHSPAVSILPSAFLASQAHAPWRSPALHPGGDSGHPQLLQHFDLLPAGPLRSRRHPDLMCNSAAGKRQTSLSTINSWPASRSRRSAPRVDTAILRLILGPWAGLQEPLGDDGAGVSRVGTAG